MSIMIDADFPTQPRPDLTRPRRRLPRELSRFEKWAWSVVMSYQFGLTAGYVALVYLGISAFIAGLPAYKETSADPDAWSNVAGLAIIAAGALAAIGSVNRSKWFERMEFAGSFLASLFTGSYALNVLWLAYANGDVGRVTAGAAYVVIAVPLVIRTLWLAAQSLRK